MLSFDTFHYLVSLAGGAQGPFLDTPVFHKQGGTTINKCDIAFFVLEMNFAWGASMYFVYACLSVTCLTTS